MLSAMRVVVIGATGTIGAAVVQALKPGHEVIGVSRKSTPGVDLENPASVAALFRGLTDVDAVVCCAGNAAFKPIGQLTDEDFAFSLRHKLMGQVNVIRNAISTGAVKDGGSITVTGGTLAQKPMPAGSAVSLVNAALEGFVRAAALEAPRGLRINVVSPPWVKETLQKLNMQAPESLSAAEVAKSYVAAIERRLNGQVIDPMRLG
jgi:NAD(P)-dependent dehydrogenase (short-subunit alcohol dehydrogenase family)